MKKYWITGVAGTGKTTVGQELANLGHYVVDVEETKGLCAWWSIESEQFVAFPDVVTSEFSVAHRWRLDMDKLEEITDDTKPSVVLVGTNETLKENMSMFEKVFILRCEPDVFIERLNNRKNNDFGKDESIQQEIMGWYKDFETRMLDAGAISIDASQSINGVADQIAKHLNS
jgi:broad-specificity NMP kinase